MSSTEGNTECKLCPHATHTHAHTYAYYLYAHKDTTETIFKRNMVELEYVLLLIFNYLKKYNLAKQGHKFPSFSTVGRVSASKSNLP